MMNRNALHLADTRRTLAAIDNEYTSIGCIGHGGFGDVFLAQRKSGRQVALKVMPMDTSDDDEYETFTREVEAVVELNRGDNGNRDLNIIYFEDWFISRNFVCIVMQYADGGTLAQEILRKAKCSPVEPYAERRIAWYALQMCDALAFAHERGVAHHDFKPANILIDAQTGGKLLLADFGTSLKPGEEAVGFTKSYASPELLASHELEDYADLRADKIDAFSLGCIIWELLHVCKLEDLSTDQTLAEFISDGPGLDAAMNTHMMRLPWLGNESVPPYVGYTSELKNLAIGFLKPNANQRLLPGQLQHALRTDPLSPLLLPKLAAAKAAMPGAPVTVDNLQLGMLVQRGHDWSDGDADGGKNSIGVVVKLDGDATYCEVAFPTRNSKPVEAICCRIGASSKYELQIGPPIPDYMSGSSSLRHDGIAHVGDKASSYTVGQMMNLNCMIVGIDKPRGIVFTAPMERYPIPSLPKPNIWQTDSTSFVSPDEDSCPPNTWQPNIGSFVNVMGMEEGKTVLDLFYDKSGGLSRRECPVESIKRVQDNWLWKSYSQRKAMVANENWGMENEIRAFISDELDNANLHNFQSSGKEFSTKASVIHRKFNMRSPKEKSQMILCRVVVGRVLDEAGKALRSATSFSGTNNHSAIIGHDLYACRGTCLAYPEYIITYKDNSAPAPSARHLDPAQPSGRSESKMCCICMERPVRYITIPCGHPCLCERCNTPQIRARLKGKCPECRSRFNLTAIIYARVVNDE